MNSSDIKINDLIAPWCHANGCSYLLECTCGLDDRMLLDFNSGGDWGQLMNTYIYPSVLRRQKRRIERLVSYEKPELHDDLEKSKIWMFTLNPDQRKLNDLPRFFKAVNKHFTSKTYKKITYVFEQRSKDPSVYDGFHIHAVFERGTAASNTKRIMMNFFGKYTDCTNSNFFVLKCVTDYDGAIKYLREKTSESKKEKSLVDKEFRKKYGLKDIYEVK